MRSAIALSAINTMSSSTASVTTLVCGEREEEVTYFDVYGVWFNIMIPETSIVSKLAHHAEIAICISIGITLDNSRQKLCILRMSNLRNKMHTIQNSSIIHQIPLHKHKVNHHPRPKNRRGVGGITRKYRSRI